MSRPGRTHMLRKVKVGPQHDECVDINEATYVVVCTLGQDHLINTKPVPSIIKVPVSVGTVPTHPQRKHDRPVRLVDPSLIHIIRQGHRPSPTSAPARFVDQLCSIADQWTLPSSARPMEPRPSNLLREAYRTRVPAYWRLGVLGR